MPIRMSGLASGMDTQAVISELMSAQRTKLTKIENKQTKLGWQQDKWKELNTKLYSLFQDKVSKLRLQSTYMKKKVTSSDTSKATATGKSNAVNGTHTLQIKNLASAQYTTGAELQNGGEKITGSTLLTDLGENMAVGSTITIKGNMDANGEGGKTVEFEVNGESTIDDFLKACQNAGLNASLDKGRIFLSSKESGTDHQFSLSSSEATTGADGTVNDGILNTLGLGQNATEVDAVDATYKYNGAEFTSSSNTVSVNGMTFQLSGTTAGYGTDDAESVMITVDTDVDAVYEEIKDFVNSYNEILKEMNDAYYASSARGYEPLSSEDKEAMTDEEVEEWENKIKDSLLRNDSTLGNLITGMKGALNKSVAIGDQKFSLSTFGIMTSSDYTEKGILHIYGDEDDSTYSEKKDKLKAALTDDPDNTIKALAGIFSNLHSEMQDKMKATSMSSALTFYQDKSFTKLERQYKTEYSEMEEKLQEMEDRYYKQFTAMETALAKLNSQQSSLAGLLGGNN